jgi:hypothetical protein
MREAIRRKLFEKKSTCLNYDEFKQKFDYRIALKPTGNYILTPLEIPDFKELSSGRTKNKESIDFTIMKFMEEQADSLLIEVLDGTKVIYSTTDTASLLAAGGDWQWDGYDSSGILDTRVLKSRNLKIHLTASQGSDQQKSELELPGKAEKTDWIDARIDRNAKTVEITLRAGFRNGGVAGSDPYKLATVATPYSDLERMAKEGIEYYWTRDGSRVDGASVINAPVKTAKGDFKVTVKVEINVAPHARKFKLFELCEPEPGTIQRSNTILNEIYHNLGTSYHAVKKKIRTLPDPDSTVLNRIRHIIDEDFKKTSAHEFGHFILTAYGGGGFWPGYSSRHKGTSHWIPQNPIKGHHLTLTGEIDLMHYHEPRPDNSTLKDPSFQDRLNRTVAAEEDVKSLLWLGRVRF